MKRILEITLILQLLLSATVALADTREKETRNKNTGTDELFDSDNELSFIEHAIKQTTVGGYISSEYEDFQSQDSTFDQHRLVLSVQSQVHERLSFFSEIEFEHGTVLSNDTTAKGEISIEDSNGDGIISDTEARNIPIRLEGSSGRSGDIEIEQAWLQFQLTKNLGMRAGVVLVPFGRFNLYHDDDLWNLTDRPLVARRVTPTTWSDAGAGFTGQFELESLGTIKGEAFVINGLTDGFSASSGGLRDARGSRESDSNNDKAFAGRLALAPSTNHEFAISGYNGNYDAHGNAITGIAFDSRNSIADFTLITELAQFNLDDGFNSAGSSAPETIKGILVELGYQFWLETLNDTFLGEGFENPKFILTARYNSASIERSAGDLDEDSYVAGLAWRPLTQFVIKTEYQWNNGELERKDADGFMTSVALGF